MTAAASEVMTLRRDKNAHIIIIIILLVEYRPNAVMSLSRANSATKKYNALASVVAVAFGSYDVHVKRFQPLS